MKIGLIIAVFMLTALPFALAEEKNPMSVTLEGYDFTAYLPEGWKISGEEPVNTPYNEFPGSHWMKAFYKEDSEDGISISVVNIPQELRGKDQRSIVGDYVGEGWAPTLEEFTFDGKPAFKGPNIIERTNGIYLIMLHNKLIGIEGTIETGNVMDLLEGMEVWKA